MFTDIKSLTQGSDPAKNEDCLAVSSNCLLILDGASGLTDRRVNPHTSSDAQWFAQRGCELLADQLTMPGSETAAVVERTLSLLKSEYLTLCQAADSRRIPGTTEEEGAPECLSSDVLPSGALEIIREESSDLSFFGLGDCKAVFELHDGSFKIAGGSNLEELDARAIESMVKIAREKGISVREARPYIQDILLYHRRLMNKEGGYPSFSFSSPLTDPITLRISRSKVKAISLYSDGYMQLVNPFSYVKNLEALHCLVANRGVEEPLRILKELQKQDANFDKFPRFKLSDDASVIYARVTQ